MNICQKDGKITISQKDGKIPISDIQKVKQIQERKKERLIYPRKKEREINISQKQRMKETNDSNMYFHQKEGQFRTQGERPGNVETKCSDSIYSRQQLLPTLEVYIWKLGVGFHLLQTVVTSYIRSIHLETRSWIPFTPDSSYFLHQWNTFGNQELDFIYSRQQLLPTLEVYIWKLGV